MKYTVQKGVADEAHTLILSGNLTIKNSEALHQLLLEQVADGKGLRLQVQEVEEMDVTFLQLLLALGRQLDGQHKPFYLQLNLNATATQLLKLSGLSPLYINH